MDAKSSGERGSQPERCVIEGGVVDNPEETYGFDETMKLPELICRIANIQSNVSEAGKQVLEEHSSIEELKRIQREHNFYEIKYLQKRAELKLDYLNGCTVVREQGWGKYLLSRMKKIAVLAGEITETDEAALSYLSHISCMSESSKELKVEFFFDANPYFVDSILTKTFRTNGEENPKLEKAVGTKINWQAGKKLTNSRSFFKFFELQPDDEARIQMAHDYQIGLKIGDAMDFSSFSYQMALPGIQLRFIHPVSYCLHSYRVLHQHFSWKKAKLEAEYQIVFRDLYRKRFEIGNGGGVPDFWLKAMKNNEVLAEQITERDERALKYLLDIEWKRLVSRGTMGFQLKFIFAPNPYFENSYLVKEFVGDQTFGSEIEWCRDQNLTHKFIAKSRKKGKPIVKPCESFFNFFNSCLISPPADPTEDTEYYGEAIVERLKVQIRYDYYVGKIIRDKIIPHGITWFTEEALQKSSEFCDLEDCYYDSNSEDGNDDEDDDEYEDVDCNDSDSEDGNDNEDDDEYEDVD